MPTEPKRHRCVPCARAKVRVHILHAHTLSYSGRRCSLLSLRCRPPAPRARPPTDGLTNAASQWELADHRTSYHPFIFIKEVTAEGPGPRSASHARHCGAAGGLVELPAWQIRSSCRPLTPLTCPTPCFARHNSGQVLRAHTLRPLLQGTTLRDDAGTLQAIQHPF